jgi:hypothetical protein
MKNISIFLITVLLIAGTVGCSGTPPVEYNLTMAVAPIGSGTATDQTGTSPYAAGTAVSIKAVAAGGYQFVNWSAPGGTFADAHAEQTTFTMPAQDVTVTANFAVGVAISDWGDLDAVRYNLGGSYFLVNDLNSGTAGYAELGSPAANAGKGWRPIGTGGEGDKFAGSLDGQGYEINDLLIDRPDESNAGLFGYVDANGVIENLGMRNGNIAGWSSVGGLVGCSEGTVRNCYFKGDATGIDVVGGLVGYNRLVTEPGIVSDSYSTGSVTGDGTHVGGLVGCNEGTVSDSYSTCNVNGNDMVGGLVGSDWHSLAGGDMIGCYATGTVSGGTWVGGLVGYYCAGNATHCYATGSVNGTTQVGGFIGFVCDFSTVNNCYSTGNVTADGDAGGFVGDSDTYMVTISGCFWDTETSGQATSDRGTGKTTAEMQDIATFSGVSWDIVGVANRGIRNLGYIWNIVDGETYPFLSWEPV